MRSDLNLYNDGVSISTDKYKLDIDVIHGSESLIISLF